MNQRFSVHVVMRDAARRLTMQWLAWQYQQFQHVSAGQATLVAHASDFEKLEVHLGLRGLSKNINILVVQL